GLVRRPRHGCRPGNRCPARYAAWGSDGHAESVKSVIDAWSISSELLPVKLQALTIDWPATRTPTPENSIPCSTGSLTARTTTSPSLAPGVASGRSTQPPSGIPAATEIVPLLSTPSMSTIVREPFATFDPLIALEATSEEPTDPDARSPAASELSTISSV